MRIALLADVHANREALEACLAHARVYGARRCIFLGDLVGYGADPRWVVETVMELVAEGSVAILGNHDAAVSARVNGMEPAANSVLDWTREQLGEREKAFLAGLPLTHEEGGLLFVHAEAVSPREWTYVNDSGDATRSIRATDCRVTFCGHVHRPALYSMTEMWRNVSEMWKSTSFRPVAGAAIPLLLQRRWLAVLGSVGQPRDGNPAASYAVLDTDRKELTYHRVPYDVEATVKRVHEVGLPGALAERLLVGR